MSNTKNVKLGVCKVYFGGVDLGYTQGGVDVTVKTDTHKVNIDQFGKTPINEYIMGREVMVKVPLAETTLENMVLIMPGATLTSNGVKASGAATFVAQPAALDTLTVNGVVFTFRTVVKTAFDILIGATLGATLTNAATVISLEALAPVTATATATVLTLTAEDNGAAGNGTTLSAFAATATNVTVSGATLSGGLDATAQTVVVPTNIGASLLDHALALVLHPQNLLDTDKSQDFTVFNAATAGQLNFAYKLENERIFSCEFNGYPDPVTSKLFAVGDTTGF